MSNIELTLNLCFAVRQKPVPQSLDFPKINYQKKHNVALEVSYSLFSSMRLCCLPGQLYTLGVKLYLYLLLSG